MKTELLERLNLIYRNNTGQDIDVPKRYDSGAYIYAEGKRPKGIYLICSGRIKIVKEGSDGKEVIVRFAGPDEFIGFVSLVKRWDYTTSAVVVDPALVQFVPKSIFLELVREDVKFANVVLDMICDQLVGERKSVEGLMMRSGKQRLATLLLSLEYAYDEDQNYDNSFVRLPRKDIAAAIKVTPETVSRYLSDFKDLGLVRTTDGIIEILSRSRLLKMSQVID